MPSSRGCSSSSHSGASCCEPDKFFTNDQGEPCPMGYLMKHGSSYQVYVLLGGP
ncbi:MAG TPA: hypothetical protein VK549_06835 [Acidimicrobiia bacterium]|nr:hypothetical protein [Acidimicrobiia bacterium]